MLLPLGVFPSWRCLFSSSSCLLLVLFRLGSEVVFASLWQRELVAQSIAALKPPYQGITKGFIPLLYEVMEMAPIFDPTADEEGQGDRGFNGALLHRLPFFYNVNHLFFYEKVSGRFVLTPAMALRVPDTPWSFRGCAL